MRRGAGGATIVLLVLSDDGLSNTVASIVMLQSSVLFPDCFFVQSQEKETVLVFVLPLLCGIFFHVLGPSIWYQGLVK